MTAAVLALPATAPFDFDASVAFVCGFAPTRGEQEAGDGRLVVALRAAGSTVLATVTAAADGPGVQVSLGADGPLRPEAASAAAARIAFWLSLDDDLAPFYDIARQDPAFRPVVERLHGYHQVKFASPWENVAWAILAQRTPMPLAQRAKRALIEHVGNAIDEDGRTWWAFPDAEQVAGARPGRPGGGRRQRAQGGLPARVARSGGRRSTSTCCAPPRTTRSATCSCACRASGRGRRGS